jgi:hypothetical protein
VYPSERALQKIVLHGHLADFGLQVLHARTGLRRRALSPGQENSLGLLEQLVLPLRDLVGMSVELLGQLGDRLSPFSAASATFDLNFAL